MGTFYVVDAGNAAQGILTRHLPAAAVGRMEDRLIYDIDGDAEKALHRDLLAGGFQPVDFLTDLVAQMDADHKASRGQTPTLAPPPPPPGLQTSAPAYPRHPGIQENPKPNQPNPGPVPLAQLHTVQIAVPAPGGVDLQPTDVADPVEAPPPPGPTQADVEAAAACITRLDKILTSETFHGQRHAHHHGRIYVGMPLGCFYWFGSDTDGYIVNRYPGPESCDGGTEIMSTQEDWHPMLAKIKAWADTWYVNLAAQVSVEEPVEEPAEHKSKRSRARSR